ncbi:MAG: non-ribosomal peptide synthetase [Minicystis sp.]
MNASAPSYRTPLQGRTISDFIQESDPTATALVAPARDPLAFGELASFATKVRLELRALGFRRSDRVGIVMPEGPELASVLLTLTSAVTTAPLNPRLHERELEFAFTDFGVRAVVVARDHDTPARPVARRCGVQLIELDRPPTGPAGLFSLQGDAVGPASEEGGATPDDLAFVLHTSGTTARPKIVPLVHGRICRTAMNIAARLRLSPDDRCLNIMPMFHVHGILNALLSSMSAGASVICSSEFDAAVFFDVMEAFRPTWYTAVPTLHQAILVHSKSRAHVIERGALRFVRSSSARLPTPVLEELERTFRAPVIESYGMTEVDQIACNPLPPDRRKAGSVGLPGGPEVVILDPSGSRLGPGELGEVAVRGDNVIDRYEASDEVNAAAFRFGYFHTGDQGYFDEDGYLFLTGRLKEIINRGGEKISPLDVEEILLAHPDVAEAAVGPIQHDQLGEDVFAAVVPRAGRSPTELELREWAAARMSSFKVPARIALVSALPKGPTGKLQRLRLAETLKLGGEPAEPPTAAPERSEDPLEAAIREVWERVLSVSPIDAREEFMALGGTSLLAARLFVELGRRFGRPLPATVMLESRTVEQMAAALRAAGWSEAR